MYKIKSLDNGLRLITAPMRGTKTATILIMVKTGSKYETRENNGISHFLEHMFFKGTAQRPNTLVLSGELDEIGGVYNAFTGKEYTGFWVKTDASMIGKATEIVGDMLFASKFARSEIEREKGVIIEEMNMYLDNPLMRIGDVFEECLYGDQPAGWDTLGIKENIRRFSRRDFLEYFRRQYDRERIFACFAGDITGRRAETLAAKHFSGRSASNWRDKEPVIEKQSGPKAKVEYKKTDQAHLALGVRAFANGHKDKHIARIMAVLLGGSMSSRLFISLRERQGLAYYVHSDAEFYSDSGYLTTQAGVPVDRIERAIATIQAEYIKLKKKAVNRRELARVKDMIRGRLVIQMEASDNIASWYAKQAIQDEKILSPEAYLKLLQKITPEDLKRVAREIFTEDRLNLAVIGPYKNGKQFRKLLKI